MKQFLLYVLATMCGIVVLSILSMLFFGVTLMSLVASDGKVVKAKDNSVFVLKLNGLVSERAEDGSPLASLTGSDVVDNMGLDDIITAIERAGDEEKVKGIVIETGVVAFDAPATAQQLRDALQAFRGKGKWVVAYGDQLLQAGYYVCSVADSLFLNQTGNIDFRGLGGKSYYLKGLYDKVGLEYQVARVGRYKSYVESVTRTDMSDDDRHQREAYLQGVWRHWLDAMAEGRGLTAARLDSLASDSIMVFAATEDYLKSGLIDRALYPEQVKASVKSLLGIGEDEEINQLTLDDVLSLKTKKKDRGDEVAVYYAYGEIVDEPLSGLADGHAIVGSKTASDLLSLADDDDVKAVVVRVNSGGGSAMASEQIWHAMKVLQEKKPVVVSMGGLAASGGYMMSCGAQYIFAEPTTITGSIGIFGLIPNVSRLVTDKLGVTWDGVTTNKYGDYETRLIFEKDNSDVLRNLQGYTDRGYERFLDIVGEARGKTRDEVNEVAQGRVWLATDALGIGLVDSLGSLSDAVAKAAALAGISDEYHRTTYPQKEDWMDRIFSGDEQRQGLLDGQLRQLLGDSYEPLRQLRLDERRSTLQARLPFDVTVR